MQHDTDLEKSWLKQIVDQERCSHVMSCQFMFLFDTLQLPVIMSTEI